MTHKVLKFTPGDGTTWTHSELSLMVSYIQIIRFGGDITSPYHPTNYKVDFTKLAQSFKDQVHIAHASGLLDGYIRFYRCKTDSEATCEIQPLEIGFSVWTNVTE